MYDKASSASTVCGFLRSCVCGVSHQVSFLVDTIVGVDEVVFMEADLGSLPEALAGLRPTVRRSRLEVLLGEHWPTIESSLKADVSERQTFALGLQTSV